MEQHTEHCTKRQKDREAWVKAWPNHCPDCMGQGGTVEHYDPSPRGVSLGAGYMTDVEPCKKCWGCCPRCGEQLYTSDDETGDAFDQQTPCPFCGWSWGKNPDDFCPEVDCYCYEIYEPEPPHRSPDDWLEAAWEDRFMSDLDY